MSEKKEEKKVEKKLTYFSEIKQVIMSKDYGSESNRVTLREFKGCDCDGAPIIEAFSAAENALSLSQIVGNYLVESLKLPLIGDITSIYFPPLAIVKNGFPSNSCRIYGNKIVFLCDYKFGPELSSSIAKAFYDFAQRHETEEILIIKGIQPPKEKENELNIEIKTSEQIEQEQNQPKSKEELMEMLFKAKKKRGDEKLLFLTNNEEFSDKMMKLGHNPIQDIVVRGISAAILAESCYQGITIAALFSPIHELNKFFQIDAAAALSIVTCIAELLKNKVVIDTKTLNEDISKIDDKMVEVIKELASPVPGKEKKQLDYYL